MGNFYEVDGLGNRLQKIGKCKFHHQAAMRVANESEQAMIGVADSQGKIVWYRAWKEVYGTFRETKVKRIKVNGCCR